jgi:hypothetical protein
MQKPQPKRRRPEPTVTYRLTVAERDHIDPAFRAFLEALSRPRPKPNTAASER